jgi:hypothetical protein
VCTEEEREKGRGRERERNLLMQLPSVKFVGWGSRLEGQAEIVAVVLRQNFLLQETVLL